MTCKDCVHYAVCEAFAKKGIPKVDPMKCRLFKDVSAFVEQIHGKWIPCKKYPDNQWYKECSCCGHIREIFSLTNYCPHCGAKMDGTEDELCKN